MSKTVITPIRYDDCNQIVRSHFPPMLELGPCRRRRRSRRSRSSLITKTAIETNAVGNAAPGVPRLPLRRGKRLISKHEKRQIVSAGRLGGPAPKPAKRHNFLSHIETVPAVRRRLAVDLKSATARSQRMHGR
jgi:hypothetical protein